MLKNQGMSLRMKRSVMLAQRLRLGESNHRDFRLVYILLCSWVYLCRLTYNMKYGQALLREVRIQKLELRSWNK